LDLILKQISQGGVEMEETSGSLKEKKIVLKKDIAVLPIWLGCGPPELHPYESFSRALSMIGRFSMCRPFVISNAEEMTGAFPYLGKVEIDIKKLFNEIKMSIAVFFVISPLVAELVWLDPFMERLKDYREKHNKRDDIFLYKIIMGICGFSSEPRYKTKSNYSDYERRSAEFGGIFSYFNYDAVTVGGSRLVELMNRIIGMDLPGEEFPDYTMEELQAISWNINRESFNSFSRREGAIDKYKIGANGRPIFPNIDTTV